MSLDPKTQEIIALSQTLIRIPSVTVGAVERLDQVQRAKTVICAYALQNGLEVQPFEAGRYPAVLIGFPGQRLAPVMLSGHFDVVAPEPDDAQFQPRIEGDYLWGRGAADMKTGAPASAMPEPYVPIGCDLPCLYFWVAYSVYGVQVQLKLNRRCHSPRHRHGRSTAKLAYRGISCRRLGLHLKTKTWHCRRLLHSLPRATADRLVTLSFHPSRILFF